MDRSKTYHFTGIKGSGMSALALILHDKGYKVQGSDIKKYFFTQQNLEEAHIPILEFDKHNIKKDMIVIAGNAFPDDHEEILRAHEMGVEVLRYHDFIGEFIEKFISIGVTGSHGKTSTTGLLAHVLSGIESTSYLIGDGTGKGVAGAKYFALEACEYKRHFLAYHPDYVIMTNIDFDHPDYFNSIEDVFSAFEEMAKQAKKAVVACGDDAYLRKLPSPVPIIYYGFEEQDDFQAVNIARTTKGSSFDVKYKGKLLEHFEVPAFGQHNILNALSVIAVCHLESLDMQLVKKQLQTFQGVKRRFSEKDVLDMVIIDDYAHHPAEIRATLDAAHQKFPNKEVIAVFQPHTFTRTVALLSDFAEALNLADTVYLCDIFSSAREKEGNVTIEDLAVKVPKGAEIVSEENLSPLLKHKDAVIIFMGAGDVQKIEFAYETALNHSTKRL